MKDDLMSYATGGRWLGLDVGEPTCKVVCHGLGRSSRQCPAFQFAPSRVQFVERLSPRGAIDCLAFSLAVNPAKVECSNPFAITSTLVDTSLAVRSSCSAHAFTLSFE
jgi:hypothetical protein